MWWDLKADKPSEIDYLNYAVLNAGLQHNISCQVNLFLVDEINFLEIEYTNPAAYKEVAAG
ncbi:ketopantoate reductase family protein [Alteromonas sp. ASW11-130]|uniref:ketopantoate reductase family protein n=1 Tax=Alteromonas sp. ASW11-130 TaxID=3015775 RepID=UPI0022423343|nr:ketopantoate reductase C-terminal domain-containing protein [Alteromonas sp. ASW11-130]MCW8090601.1 hypothetical protein [Alteromonas sp. ASW11-130]